MIAAAVKKAVATAAATGGAFIGLTSYKIYDLKKTCTLGTCASTKPDEYLSKLPTRQEHIRGMMDTPEYDVLVIGGGATGTGVALDAQTRGLKTALVEREDFASQTSSKSTKLIHGGVRYLQAAILGLDMEQYRMVKEALRERANFLTIAPHLTKALPILLPLYAWWKVPYMWFGIQIQFHGCDNLLGKDDFAGIKLYDIVSGDTVLRHSYYFNKEQSSDAFPQLETSQLKGSIVYFDGQQNDARMCLTLVLTAARMGANVANYVEVQKLVKEHDGKSDVVRGAVVRDVLTGKEWTIRAKCVINATGPFTDAIRKMDNPSAEPICQPSSGVHISLPSYYCPKKLGLLNAETSDGRVIFILPWQGITIAGTTDEKCPVTNNPIATEKDIDFVLRECQKMLKLRITRKDVLSACIEVSPSKLVTIAGGKWTTYRAMAEHTVDKAIQVCNLSPKHNCQTIGFQLDGAHGYDSSLFIRLMNEYGIDRSVAKHLIRQYGTRATDVLRLAEPTGKAFPLTGVKLVDKYPYLEAEVRYAVQSEYAVNAVDVVARRTRIAFQDVDAARQALPRIIEIMGQQLNWSSTEKNRQTELALKFVNEQMGYKIVHSGKNKGSYEDVANCLRKFNEVTSGRKMTFTGLKNTLKSLAVAELSNDELESVLRRLEMWRPEKTITATEFLSVVAFLRRSGKRL